MKTAEQWIKTCEKITAGYTPTGGKAATYTSGLKIASWLQQLPVNLKGKVLDIGCGNGRLAMGLDALGFTGQYYGFEIIHPCVEFCRMAFADSPRYHFAHVDVHSDHYWPKGAIRPEEVRYPYAANTFDTAVAMSVFSHTGRFVVALANLKEAGRVLKVGGTFVSTWYLGDNFIMDEALTVYTKDQFFEMIFAAGFSLLQPFDTTSWEQTAVILEKMDVSKESQTF